MPPIENPYASPQEVSSVAPALTNHQRVKKLLFQPGLVTATSGVLMTFGSAHYLHQFLLLIRLHSDSPPDAISPARGLRGLELGAVFISLVFFGSLVCIYGGVQMLRLKHYRICVLAALVMAVPFTSPCNLVGLIIGTWTLVILLQKDTRAAFAEGKQ